MSNKGKKEEYWKFVNLEIIENWRMEGEEVIFGTALIQVDWKNVSHPCSHLESNKVLTIVKSPGQNLNKTAILLRLTPLI